MHYQNQEVPSWQIHIQRGFLLHGSEYVYSSSANLVNYLSKKTKNTVVLSIMHDKRKIRGGAPECKPEMIL